MKSRQALILPLESEPVLEPEEVEAEEVGAVEEAPAAPAPATTTWVSFPAEDWGGSEEDAGAVAAMTPRAPRDVPVPTGSSAPAWSPPAPAPVMPPRAAVPVPAFEANPRPSVAPVVATLPPIETAPQLPPRRGSMSADSKLLAAGGALAAAMLLVAVGVLLGQHSTGPAPSAASTGSYPLVVDTKAPAAVALPAAPRPVEARPTVAETPAERVDAPKAVDVQNLPAAARPRAQEWSVAAPARPTPAGSGWTVAPVVRAAPTTTPLKDTQAPASNETAPTASAAPEAPAPSTAPSVDFVQAVRQDIREDEERTK